jgi:hypothetical protein
MVYKDYFLLPTGLVIMVYKDYFLLPTGLDYKQYGNLLSSLQKFYGRQHKLVDHYEIFIFQIAIDIFPFT